MIQENEIRVGNWISLDLRGSLLEAYKVIEIAEDGLTIESGTAYTLVLVGNKWEYPLLPQKSLLSFEKVKGIPLTIAVLESCGFTVSREIISIQLSPANASVNISETEKLFTLNYMPGPPEKFSHAATNSTIEFVHQLQNVFADCVKRELDITIEQYNFKLASDGFNNF